MRSLTAILTILCFTLTLMQPAPCQQKADIDKLLKEGKEAYLNGDYNQAIQKLSVAVRYMDVKEDLVEANIILALVYLSTGDTTNCERFIVETLKVKPDLELSEAEYSPKFISLVEKCQTENVITTIFKIAAGGILYLNGFRCGKGTFFEVKVFKGKNAIKVINGKFEPFEDQLVLTEDGAIREIPLRARGVADNGIMEKAGVKKRKKFPWLIIVGGIIVAGALLYFLVLKKPRYTLTTTLGEGVNGSPSSGSTSYKKNEQVTYNFVAGPGFTNLAVTLDGQEVNASGIIKMNRNHKLEASAVPGQGSQHTLLVLKGNGVNGNPGTGLYTYNEGETVAYNYTLMNGYKDILVKVDGTKVNTSGTIKMDQDHTLSVSAAPTSGQTTLTVNRGGGVSGSPASGTYSYQAGDTVTYSYSLKSGYSNLQVKLDGEEVGASGTISMDRDHTLNATASSSGGDEFVLTVSIGEGVSGTPTGGSYKHGKGTKVHYSYTLDSGYVNLVVKLDGATVSKSGTITMNDSHNLTASATSNLGNIFVTSQPAGAAIWLDGKDTGQTTPDTLQNIPAGPHTITLIKKNFEQATGEVDVIAGETVNFHKVLKKS